MGLRRDDELALPDAGSPKLHDQAATPPVDWSTNETVWSVVGAAGEYVNADVITEVGGAAMLTVTVFDAADWPALLLAVT